MADWNAGSAAMDSYESIATETAFQSAIHAVSGNETEIAKLRTKHLSDFGGYYFADCTVALEGSHPLPAPPGRWGLSDVKKLLKCIVQAWSLKITLHVFPYDDQMLTG